tara:strand:- start:465 stop:1394 length:930 start_codon:yes stop_codon:yes gene_type:complete
MDPAIDQHFAPPWLRQLPELPAWTHQRPAAPWNLRGMLAAWEDHPRSMDFLEPSSPNFHYKEVQTRLYLGRLKGLIEALPMSSLVLDMGCGIGRTLLPLAERGHRVTGVDACLPSLQAAARHIQTALASGAILEGGSPRLFWDDVEQLNCLEGEDRYQLILALELICYLHDPRTVLEQLAARLEDGGHLVISVEAWPGALLCDPIALDSPERIQRALDDRIIAVEGDRWVRALDASELESILRSVDLDVVGIEGSHFFPDGPLAACLDLERLKDPGYVDAVLELEHRCSTDPQVNQLPRALLAVARKRG